MLIYSHIQGLECLWSLEKVWGLWDSSGPDLCMEKGKSIDHTVVQSKSNIELSQQLTKAGRRERQLMVEEVWYKAKARNEEIPS